MIILPTGSPIKPKGGFNLVAPPPPESAPEVTGVFCTMSPEAFKELQEEIFKIQAKLTSQIPVTLEEEKKINIWFREKRGIAMSVMKEKVKKESTRTPAVRKTPAVKKSSVAEQRRAIEADIFSDLFS